MSDEPTIDNVRPEAREHYLGVQKPYAEKAAVGAIVAVAGDAPCPWCGAACIEREETCVAVCERDPRHVVEWLPWGG